jgi:outer membrane protein assembly factor BamB
MSECQNVSKFRLAQLFVSLIAASAVSLPMAASAAALFEADYGSGKIFKFNPDGTGKTAFATGLSGPAVLAFDASGNLFESDYLSGKIFKFNPDGTGKTAFATGLSGPLALAFAPEVSNSTAVPEPFTIIGTLVGGTAAMRMRKKLK